MRLLDGKEDKKEYLIKWEGYPLEECTWEPEDTMIEDCKAIIIDYNKLLKNYKQDCITNNNTRYKYLKQGDLYYQRFDLKNNPLTKEEVQLLEKNQSRHQDKQRSMTKQSRKRVKLGEKS